MATGTRRSRIQGLILISALTAAPGESASPGPAHPSLAGHIAVSPLAFALDRDDPSNPAFAARGRGYGLWVTKGGFSIVVPDGERKGRPHRSSVVQVYATEGELEYDLVFASGSDPRGVTLRFDGVKALRVSEEGQVLRQDETAARAA